MSLSEDSIFFIYPLQKNKKHLQKWFTGNYLYLTNIVMSTYIAYYDITLFLICEMTGNFYFDIYKKPISIKQIDELKPIHNMFNYLLTHVANRIHITKLFKFKNFDRNLIPENIKRLIVETL